MQALLLMVVYILTTVALQMVGAGISRAVQHVFPALGLMTFLILFLGAFALAWPIAYWLTVTGLVKAGFKVEGADPRAI
jgi:hypothetical protein